MPQAWDVIVVGAGGSGLAAAVSAAEAGGRVLVLEKRPAPGGTTGIAVGSFTAAETAWQRNAGIADSVGDHAVDAGRFAAPEIEGRNNAELRRFFLSEAAATLDWLAQFGLTFVGPHPEPPNRAPRMHNVIPGAKAYIAALQSALVARGGEIWCNAAVESLSFDESGLSRRVTGVVVRRGESSLGVNARRGVILAAGDYANDPSLIAQYKGDRFRQIEGINPFAGGDGHRLAESAGAELRNMDVTYGPELRFVASRRRPFQQLLPASGRLARVAGWAAARMPKTWMRAFIKRLLVTWQHPENALFDDGAILLNAAGRRFVDETRWPEREIAVANQPGKQAYVLLDGPLAERFSAWPHFISTAPDIAYAYVDDYLRLRPDVAIQSDNLATVLRKRGIDAAAANETLREYNAGAPGGELAGSRESVAESESTCDPTGRDAASRRALERGPWTLLGPVKAYFTTTEGGAMVNRRLQATDANGRPIPGLYAVGQTGLGGMILWGHGLHIAWAMTSGRLAGRAAMQDSGE